MKKLLETSLGNWSDTWFSKNGKRVSDEEAIKLIKEECNPYITKSDGVIVYMSKKEYKSLTSD